MKIKDIKNNSDLPIHIYSSHKGYSWEYEIENNYINDYGDIEAKELYIKKDSIDIFI